MLHVIITVMMRCNIIDGPTSQIKIRNSVETRYEGRRVTRYEYIATRFRCHIVEGHRSAIRKGNRNWKERDPK